MSLGSEVGLINEVKFRRFLESAEPEVAMRRRIVYRFICSMRCHNYIMYIYMYYKELKTNIYIYI